ncbi:hypothetical protein BX616_009760 [Lobosporangium transversale]|nr:hypothetical protein BX616_009760 [Lobosporangium transversale]
MARPLALNLGLVLVVSNIVAKNFRIYRIFHNIYVTKRVIKDSHLLKIVGTIMMGNLSPPTLEQIAMPDFTSYWSCDNTSGGSVPFFVLLFVYNGVLLLIATYLAYMNRNVATNYNECRQIAFVVYNILLSGCLALPTVFLPRSQFLIKFFLSTGVFLFGTTFSLLFLFLPKLWELYSQIERTQQQQRQNNCSSAVHGERSTHMGLGPGLSPGSVLESRSAENFIYNMASTWMNSSSNIGVLGPSASSDMMLGSTGAGGGDHSSYGNGNGARSSTYLSYGRKGSAASLEDYKGGGGEDDGNTLKEMHMGYMGVKFQSRFWPLSFISNWRMGRIVLYPTGRYFTCFELGKPETGRTYTYTSVCIHSREPGEYILVVMGTRRYDFLLQVRDEERLMYWYNLFDSYPRPRQGSNGNINTIAYSSSHDMRSIMLPLGDLSMANLAAAANAATANAATESGNASGIASGNATAAVVESQ